MRDCNAMDCGTCERWPSTLCVGPVITRVSVSRMLEICMSGSMRGSGYRRSLLDILRRNRRTFSSSFGCRLKSAGIRHSRRVQAGIGTVSSRRSPQCKRVRSCFFGTHD